MYSELFHLFIITAHQNLYLIEKLLWNLNNVKWKMFIILSIIPVRELSLAPFVQPDAHFDAAWGGMHATCTDLPLHCLEWNILLFPLVLRRVHWLTSAECEQKRAVHFHESGCVIQQAFDTRSHSLPYCQWMEVIWRDKGWNVVKQITDKH